MFTVPRTNVIESDEGYSVEVTSPTELLYCDGSRSWRISTELLADDKVPIAIYKNTLTQIGGAQSDGSVSESQRTTIMNNIERAFAFRGVGVQIM